MVQNETKSILTGKRLKVAEMLANPGCMLTQEKIAESAGVSHTTFYRWMQDADFIREVEKLIDKYTDAKLSYAWRCLLTRMPVDTAAIKLYFELKGKYKQDIKISGQIENPYGGLTQEQLEKLADGHSG